MGGTSEGGRGGFATGTSEVQSLRPAESGGNAPAPLTYQPDILSQYQPTPNIPISSQYQPDIAISGQYQANISLILQYQANISLILQYQADIGLILHIRGRLILA